MSHELSKEQQLDRILKLKRNYSFSHVRKHLGIKQDIVFFNFLNQYFNSKLDDYKFDGNISQNQALLKLLPYYTESLNKRFNSLTNTKEKRKYITNLERICNRIKNMISKTVSEGVNNTKLENSIELLTIEESLENIHKLLESNNELPAKTDIIDKHILKDIIKELVFNMKDSDILESLFSKIPTSILFQENNRFIFEEVLDRYYQTLAYSNDHNLKLYYDKVIDLYTKYANFSNSEVIIDIFNRKMDKFKSNAILKVEDPVKKRNNLI